MAIGTFNFYNTGKEALLSDNLDQINWVNDTIVAVLLTTSYTPQATHTAYSDVSANVVSMSDYAPVVLSSKTSVRSNGIILWDCANIDYGATVTLSAKTLVLVKRASGVLAPTDQLIGYVDLNTDGPTAVASSTSAAFAINTPNGLFSV